MPSFPEQIAFFAIVSAVYAALFGALRHAQSNATRAVSLKNFALLLVGWACVSGALAQAGFFAVHQQPWRALPLVALTLAFTVWCSRSPAGQILIDATPLWSWPALQSFRLPMEWLLHSLYENGVIGVQMTYEGRNFDILVGASAPLMALALWRTGHLTWVRRLALGWNLLGMLLLANILVVGVLSVPFPFQVFTDGPPNRMVTEFPFVWLPFLLIPLALFAHIASWRQLRVDVYRPSTTAAQRL